MTVVTVAGFFAAAALGAVVRTLAGWLLNREIPLGTLMVNLVASFLLGLIVGAGVAESMSIVVGVGALGSLSTWSTLANEAAIMARQGEGKLALAYLALTVLAGIVVAWLGLRIGAVIE